jgi:hypothetical protein
MIACGDRVAQAGADADVVLGHLGEQDLALLEGALPDQALAQGEARRHVSRSL